MRLAKPILFIATILTLELNVSAQVGETFRIKSTRLKEEREIRVYLPSSYANSKQSYPVVYALDGEGTGPVTASAIQFMTGYSTIPQMPEALVVAITNTDRNRDMPVPRAYGKGGEENFLGFLSDELIPEVERRFRTVPLRILLGHSQGGLFAIYALANRPAVFQWYLSMDAPLAGFAEMKPMMEKTRTVITKPNFHGRLVSVENLYGWRKEWATLVQAAPNGFYGEQVEIKDETHETMAYKGVYEGLKRLFHDYAPNLVKESKGIYTLPVLEEMYKQLSLSYGYQVAIPKQLLLTAAAQNTAMQYGAEAIELINRAVSLYGESPDSKRLIAEAEEAAKKGRDPRIAEWANLPGPRIEQMKPFLGAWETTVGDGARESITFEIKDGAVRSQCTLTPREGDPFQMQVKFVRVLEDQTLQWGLANGRGAGILLRTVKLINPTTLRGTAEPVGIEYAPPPHPITYNRRAS
jgi:hypothetical protein